MAKLYPISQVFFDIKDVTGIGRQEQLGVTRIEILGTDSPNSDNIELPGTTEDAALLQEDRTTADPTFYLSGNNNTRLNIDGATAGTQYLVVSKHVGMMNTSATEGDT